MQRVNEKALMAALGESNWNRLRGEHVVSILQDYRDLWGEIRIQNDVVLEEGECFDTLYIFPPHKIMGNEVPYEAEEIRMLELLGKALDSDELNTYRDAKLGYYIRVWWD